MAGALAHLTGRRGLRNRRPPPEVWNALGRIDIALLPVDNSQHVMGFEMTAHIFETLRPHVVIPHHYYIRDVLQRQSTLQCAEPWVATREVAENPRAKVVLPHCRGPRSAVTGARRSPARTASSSRGRGR